MFISKDFALSTPNPAHKNLCMIFEQSIVSHCTDFIIIYVWYLKYSKSLYRFFVIIFKTLKRKLQQCFSDSSIVFFFYFLGFVGRRKRQSTITMIRSCSDCAGLDGINIEDYINIGIEICLIIKIQWCLSWIYFHFVLG